MKKEACNIRMESRHQDGYFFFKASVELLIKDNWTLESWSFRRKWLIFGNYVGTAKLVRYL